MALGVEEGIEQAVQGMKRYTNPSWRIAFSGGKDSTALVTLMAYLVDSKKIPTPVYAYVSIVDTRQELPPLIENAERVADLVKKRLGWTIHFIKPDIKDSFLFHLLGRGLFTPGSNGRNRWCTRILKQDPMRELEKSLGTDSLLLYGSRIDESDARAVRMANSCSLEGAECGVGLFMVKDGVESYSPLTNWRNCAVWDWLMMANKLIGFDPSLLYELYADADKFAKTMEPEDILEAIDSTTRTGCIGCPVVGHDYALSRVVKFERWAHLSPFLPLRELYVELRKHEHRLRMPFGEKRANGEPNKKPGRVGPICIESRIYALEKIRAMQAESNGIADKKGLSRFVLLSQELDDLIVEAITNKTFPRGWRGDEPLAESTNPVGQQVAESFL